MMIPLVGKSGPFTCSIRSDSSASGLSRSTALDHFFPQVVGRCRWPCPRAVPEEPLTSRFGNREGSTRRFLPALVEDFQVPSTCSAASASKCWQCGPRVGSHTRRWSRSCGHPPGGGAWRNPKPGTPAWYTEHSPCGVVAAPASPTQVANFLATVPQ